MFTLSTDFRVSRKPDALGHVLYQIKKGGHITTIPTGIYSSDRDVVYSRKDEISFGLKSIYCVIETLSRNNGTISLKEIAEKSSEILNGTNPYTARIKELGNKFPIDPDLASISPAFRDEFTIVRPVSTVPDNGMLLEYMERLVIELKNNGRGVASSYRNTHHSLSRFMDGNDRAIASIDTEFIESYNFYLSGLVTSDSRAFYLRVLRSTLNHARKSGHTIRKISWPEKIDVSPYAARKNTNLKVLDQNTIRKIAALDLSQDKKVEYVRDLFMFCFYAQGMELIDLANLRYDDLKDNRLSYHRRLRGRLVEVELGSRALDIIDRYHENGSDWLFPLLFDRGRPYSFDKVKADTRKAMIAIGELMEPPLKLSFGMSRRSWMAMTEKMNLSEMMLSK